MANLTADLQAPNVRAASIPQRGVVDDSDARALAGLSNLVTSFGASAEAARKEQQRLDAGRAVGDTATNILDLQDERTRLQIDREQADTTVAGIHADGVVTPEEQRTLDGLQGQFDTLNQARRSGVLNDKVFSIRMNALQRSALARVENLGIQANINSIFNQGRSPAFAIDPQRQTIEQQMNAMHGNDWDEAKVGEFIGKQQYVASMTQQGIKTLTNLGNQVNTAFDISMQRLNLQFSQLAQQQGNAFSDDQRAMHTSQVNTTLQETLLHIDQKAAEARARNEVVDQAAIRSMKAELVKQAEWYTTTVFDEGYLKGRSALDVLNNRNKLADSMYEAQTGMSAEQMSALANGGMLGSQNFDSLNRILSDETKLRIIMDNNPTINSIAEAKTSVSRYMASLVTNGYASSADLQMSPSQRKFYDGLILSKSQIDGNDNIATEIQVQQYNNTYRIDGTSGDVADIIKAGHAQGMKLATQGGPRGKQAVVEGRQQIWIEIQRRAAELDIPITIDDRGLPVIGDPVLDPGTSSIVGRAPSQIRGQVQVGEMTQVLGASVLQMEQAGILTRDQVFVGGAGQDTTNELTPEEQAIEAPEEADALPDDLSTLTQEDFNNMSARQRTAVLRKAGFNV
jgi:hypothetical protein